MPPLMAYKLAKDPIRSPMMLIKNIKGKDPNGSMLPIYIERKKVDMTEKMRAW